MSIGPILARTVRHFFPDLNAWIDQIDDPRFPPYIIYHKRFLMWWGLSLYLCKLSSRRQLDFPFDNDGPEVLNNLSGPVQLAEEQGPAVAGEPALMALAGQRL